MTRLRCLWAVTAVLCCAAATVGADPGGERRRGRPVRDGRRLLQRTNFDQRFERLVLKFRDGTGVRARAGRLVIEAATSATLDAAARGRLSAELRTAERLVQQRGLSLSPLFPQPEALLDAWRVDVERRRTRPAIDLNLYVAVHLPTGRHPALEELAWALVGLPCLEIVYPETFTAYPDDSWDPGEWEAPAGITPLLVGQQGYLAAAPDGVGAFAAWGVPGGTGAGVRVYDIDTGVNASHEDLPPLFASDGAGWDEAHGTAVLGIIAARHNGLGLKGVAYNAQIGLKHASSMGMSGVILAAAMELQAGDVILIETAKSLDGWDCACNPTQAGSVAQEYYQAQFDVIEMATSAGITVVQVSGNGCVDYDDPSFDGWFDREVQDSGSIIVGASLSTGRTPTCYSSYGSRIDLHAWGENIVCLQFLRETEVPVFDGGSLDRLYGPNFGGTSGAGAIVAGVVASLQGVAKAQAPFLPLPADELRDLLRDTGTAQSGDLDRPIGPMPNLEAAIAAMP
jgi:serine protease